VGAICISNSLRNRFHRRSPGRPGSFPLRGGPASLTDQEPALSCYVGDGACGWAAPPGNPRLLVGGFGPVSPAVLGHRSEDGFPGAAFSVELGQLDLPADLGMRHRVFARRRFAGLYMPDDLAPTRAAPPGTWTLVAAPLRTNTAERLGDRFCLDVFQPSPRFFFFFFFFFFLAFFFFFFFLSGTLRRGGENCPTRVRGISLLAWFGAGLRSLEFLFFSGPLLFFFFFLLWRIVGGADQQSRWFSGGRCSVFGALEHKSNPREFSPAMASLQNTKQTTHYTGGHRPFSRPLVGGGEPDNRGAMRRNLFGPPRSPAGSVGGDRVGMFAAYSSYPSGPSWFQQFTDLDAFDPVNLPQKRPPTRGPAGW